jgi:hypothetical protein
MTHETIQFYPEGWANYWPNINTSVGYPAIHLNVSYLENGCMILEGIEFPRREFMTFNYSKWNDLLKEVTGYVSQFNTISL